MEASIIPSVLSPQSGFKKHDRALLLEGWKAIEISILVDTLSMIYLATALLETRSKGYESVL